MNKLLFWKWRNVHSSHGPTWQNQPPPNVQWLKFCVTAVDGRGLLAPGEALPGARTLAWAARQWVSVLQHSGGPRPEPHLQGRAGHRPGNLGEVLPKSGLLGSAANTSECSGVWRDRWERICLLFLVILLLGIKEFLKQRSLTLFPPASKDDRKCLFFDGRDGGATLSALSLFFFRARQMSRVNSWCMLTFLQSTSSQSTLWDFNLHAELNAVTSKCSKSSNWTSSSPAVDLNESNWHDIDSVFHTLL